MAFGAELPSRRRRTAAPPAPKKRAGPTLAPKAKPAPPPAPTKKKKPAAKMNRVTQPPAAARPVNAPEGAVFDHAARLHGKWVSPWRRGGPKGPAPVWCLWREDFELMDDDDDDTPLKGAWEVKWSDRTASFLAQDDVRVCVPTRERLKAQAQAPTPTSTCLLYTSPSPRD